MQKRSPHNFSLSSEEVYNQPDELLQLNQSALIAVLTHLQSSDSIGSLRRSLLDIRQQLYNPDSSLRSRPSEEEVIEFTSGYLAEEIDQIATSQTLERALYYVERLIKSITEVRVNGINDINLNRWKEYNDIYLDSLWNIDKRENSGVHSAGYWGNFIPQIPYQMMRRYTKKGDWVLDTFAGSGTTLIEGQRLGRNTIGIELQEDVAEETRHIIALEPNTHGVVSEVVTADSASVDYVNLLRRYDKQSVQLVLLHPPYFDIIKFSDDKRDLSNAASIENFLQMMGKVVGNAAPILDQDRYLVLVISDKYAKGEWIPLGFLTMNEVLKHGFILKSIIVKNFEETTGKRQQKELWNYRALVGGFYIFKHEYIFVFRKS